MIKRISEICLAILLLVLFTVPIILLVFISTIVFQEWGLFAQSRVGKESKMFKIYKIKSMSKTGYKNTYSKFIRKNKLDELPQLINIVLGDMSFIGPRPELPEYFVKFTEYPKELLSMKPGLTGLASLYFFDEEKEFESFEDSDLQLWIYNSKNRLNRFYANNQTLCFDFKILYLTVVRLINS